MTPWFTNIKLMSFTISSCWQCKYCLTAKHLVLTTKRHHRDIKYYFIAIYIFVIMINTVVDQERFMFDNSSWKVSLYSEHKNIFLCFVFHRSQQKHQAGQNKSQGMVNYYFSVTIIVTEKQRLGFLVVKQEAVKIGLNKIMPKDLHIILYF